MSDFLQLAQSLAVALKALQMYTAAHPRAQEALSGAQGALESWLAGQGRLQFVVSGTKAFLDGQVQDTRPPHVASLVKLVSERGVSGFVFERGLTSDEFLAFMEGLAAKPQKIEEQGGFEAVLQKAGVRHIKVSQTRYQEVREGEGASPEDRPPSPAAPSPSPDNLVKFIREALLTTLGRNAAQIAGLAGEDTNSGIARALRAFRPADLSGLGPLGYDLGLGEGMPTPVQLATLRQVLMGLSPEVQLELLAGLASLPSRPAGLGLGVKTLAPELLSVATTSLLAKGVPWVHLRGPLQDILRPLSDRAALVHALSTFLRASAQDAAPAEAILRHLEWEALSLEAKLLKVLEEEHLFELSLEQRLAFLRELLDLRRFDEFLKVQDLLLDCLQTDRPDLRLKTAQTLAGMSRWARDPGLPPGSEGSLAEALRAHFAWEPDPPIHRWTTEALESLLEALILRGDLQGVQADLQELRGLCEFLEDQVPWRNEALGQLHAALLRPSLLDAAVDHGFALEREQMLQELHPYLEFLGDPMARHLMARLEAERDRTRRGRLVDAVRSMGPAALPALLDALDSPAWYLVRNALTLLADLGDAGSAPALIPHLRHPEPRVRRAAVRALWKLGGPAAEPHLLAQMKETDGETMQEVLFALGQLRSEHSIPHVAGLAQDKRVLERLRLQALDTLSHIASPKTVPALLECLRRKGFFGHGESPAIRLAAAKALAGMPFPEAREALQRVVDAEPKGEEREAFLRLLDPPAQP